MKKTRTAPHLQAVVGRAPGAVDGYVQHHRAAAGPEVRPDGLPAVEHQLVHLQQRVDVVAAAAVVAASRSPGRCGRFSAVG